MAGQQDRPLVMGQQSEPGGADRRAGHGWELVRPGSVVEQESAGADPVLDVLPVAPGRADAQLGEMAKHVLDDDTRSTPRKFKRVHGFNMLEFEGELNIGLVPRNPRTAGWCAEVAPR